MSASNHECTRHRVWHYAIAATKEWRRTCRRSWNRWRTNAEEADRKEKAQKKKDEEEEAAAEKSGKRIPITKQLARKSSARASKKFQETLWAAKDRSETARDKARHEQVKEFEICERCKKRVRLGGGCKICAKCMCELEELEKAQKAEKEKKDKK
jgi:hypothetical protein